MGDEYEYEDKHKIFLNIKGTQKFADFFKKNIIIRKRIATIIYYDLLISINYCYKNNLPLTHVIKGDLTKDGKEHTLCFEEDEIEHLPDFKNFWDKQK